MEKTVLSRTPSLGKSLRLEASTLCIYCGPDMWKKVEPMLIECLEWKNSWLWRNDTGQYALSGQRTLVARLVGDADQLSLKIKGHHLATYRATSVPMIFEYDKFEKASLLPYSELAKTGPFLPSGHSANAGWWSREINIDDHFVMTYTDPCQDAPCGAMLLSTATHEIESLCEARSRACTQLIPVAVGAYSGDFQGAPVGFNVIAGALENDNRLNGLFKGLVLPAEDNPSIYVPGSFLRECLKTVNPLASDLGIIDDPTLISRLWINVSEELGRSLRRIHLASMSHGGPDFGNACLARLEKGRIELAFLDWESASLLDGEPSNIVIARRLEDFAYLAHSLLLEAKNNPFFIAISSPEELLACILRTYLDTSHSVAANLAMDLIQGLRTLIDALPPSNRSFSLSEFAATLESASSKIPRRSSRLKHPRAVKSREK